MFRFKYIFLFGYLFSPLKFNTYRKRNERSILGEVEVIGLIPEAIGILT